MMKSVQVDQRLPRLHQCAEFRLLEVDRRTLGFLDPQSPASRSSINEWRKGAEPYLFRSSLLLRQWYELQSDL